MPTALLFVRKIHEKLFLQAGNGGVMQQNKVKIKTSHAQKKENRAGYFFIAPYLTFFYGLYRDSFSDGDWNVFSEH